MNTRNTTAQRLRTALTTTAILALGATFASAHPGHALDAEPVSHLVTSPYHLITLTVVGAGLLVGGMFVKRLAARRAMQITGVAALAIATVTAATHLLH
jgi:hypothetical protein